MENISINAFVINFMQPSQEVNNTVAAVSISPAHGPDQVCL